MTDMIADVLIRLDGSVVGSLLFGIVQDKVNPSSRYVVSIVGSRRFVQLPAPIVHLHKTASL